MPGRGFCVSKLIKYEHTHTHYQSTISTLLCLSNVVLCRTSNTVGQIPNKYQSRRDFALPGNTSVPRAVSYEDFRKHMDTTLSKKSSDGSTFGMRKAKSDTDVAMQTMKKKIEVR